MLYIFIMYISTNIIQLQLAKDGVQYYRGGGHSQVIAEEIGKWIEKLKYYRDIHGNMRQLDITRYIYIY